MIASFGFDCGAHPLMVPSKVANKNMADQPCTWKSADPLKTIPVGEPGPAPLSDGTNTCRPFLTPPPVYSVDQPEPLSLSQKGPPGAYVSPHAFTISGSVCLAIPT